MVDASTGDAGGSDGEGSNVAPDQAERVLDVREIDGEPFGDVVAALESLGDDEQPVLVSGFEPVPPYDVLEERGFAHETTRVDDEWRVGIVPADAT